MKRSILRKLIRGCEYCFTMLNLLNKYSKESPDIIHIQWLLFYRFDYFWLRILRYLLRRKNTKIILTAHNILPHVNGYKYKNILEKIYSNFDGIIVHSKVLKTQMIEVFGAKAKNWPICVEGIKLIVVGPYSEEIIYKLKNKWGDIITEKVYFTGLVPQKKLVDFSDHAIASIILYKKNIDNLWLCASNRLYQALIRGIPVIVGIIPLWPIWLTNIIAE